MYSQALVDVAESRLAFALIGIGRVIDGSCE